MRKTGKGIYFVGIYVNDNILIGHPAAIDKTISELQIKGLVLKIENQFNDYLSCEIIFSKDRKKAWLGQHHLIANLKGQIGDEVEGLIKYQAPGTPSLNQIRELDKSLCLPKEKQTHLRSGVDFFCI